MPVNARRLIRKMRGGAQAHLIECDDDRFYVVKFRNNPQHRRVLVNEWISAVFLRFLQISAPEVALVNLSGEFLAEEPDVHLQLGSKRTPPEAGWHFGSCHPGHPDRISIYDFLPDALIEKVVNLPEFAGILAFDKWMGNADARQCIYFRARLRQWAPAYAQGAHHTKLGFVAQMMDHGFVFNGPHWTFTDSPLQGVYFRPVVYQNIRSFEGFQPWLDRIQHFPEEVVDDALKQLPPQWVEGDGPAIEELLTKLLARRKRLPDLIRQSSTGRANLFPNWK